MTNNNNLYAYNSTKSSNKANSINKGMSGTISNITTGKISSAFLLNAETTSKILNTKEFTMEEYSKDKEFIESVLSDKRTIQFQLDNAHIYNSNYLIYLKDQYDKYQKELKK